MLQDVALDKRLASVAVEPFIKTLTKSLTDSEFAAMMVRDAFQRSLDAIFDQTESPLEKQFFTSLLFHSLRFHFLGFWIQRNGPNIGAPEQLDEHVVLAEQLLEQYLRWKALPGAKYGQFKYLLEKAGIPPEEASSREAFCEFEFDFGLYYRPWIMLQPRFPDIRVAGRSVRADALVYIPYIQRPVLSSSATAGSSTMTKSRSAGIAPVTGHSLTRGTSFADTPVPRSMSRASMPLTILWSIFTPLSTATPEQSKHSCVSSGKNVALRAPNRRCRTDHS
jgi:hypothetical protein